jgi:dihydroflavonol-4-reductase
VTWVAGADVAAGAIAAMDRGVAGERYLLVGQPDDTLSTAAGINRACEIAGIGGLRLLIPWLCNLGRLQ